MEEIDLSTTWFKKEDDQDRKTRKNIKDSTLIQFLLELVKIETMGLRRSERLKSA